MIRILLAVAATLCFASPAAAHSLRVFAKVEGQEVSGYGFFVGGGRPQGVDWSARTEDTEIAHGKTDADGSFAFDAPDPVTAPITVTINSGEGHIASKILPPDRFASSRTVEPQPAKAAPVPIIAAATMANRDVLTKVMIENAVERQVAPLLERIEQMDARMRLTDVVAAVCLILGMAGIALWARGRRG